MATKPRLAPITFYDADILFLNFAGQEKQYNAKGERNFCLKLDPETAALMKADGWNIKHLKARDDETEEQRQAYVQVKVRFDGARPPVVVIITSRGRTTMTEEVVELVDYMNIGKVDLIINPSRWEVNGETGIKAYLKSIYITINEDELELKYADVPELERGQEQLALEQSYEYAEVIEDGDEF